MYLDTCYIAKFYLNEPESKGVRELVRKAGALYSSVWAMAEYHAVLHRHLREGRTTPGDSRELSLRFFEHLEAGLWNLIPVNEGVLRGTRALIVSAPRDLFLRTADAVHLTTARKPVNTRCGLTIATCSPPPLILACRAGPFSYDTFLCLKSNASSTSCKPAITVPPGMAQR